MARVSLPPPGLELALAETLRRLGARALERTGGTVVAHFPPPPELDAFRREVEALVRHTPGLEGLAVRWSWRAARRQETGWAREWAGPGAVRQITPRLAVVPSSLPYEGEPECLVIRLAPGPAFGSAAHPTTRGCLRLLESLVRPGDRVLDVGTGSGVLAVAAAFLGAESVTALERDPVAAAAARQNVDTNGLGDRVRVETRTALAHHPPHTPPAHGIAANLGPELILGLLPWFDQSLAPGGWLVLSGVPDPDLARIRVAAGALGLEAEARDLDDGWWSGAFRKRAPRREDPTCPGRSAMSRPAGGARSA